ncbi:hypothetical protein [Kribbella swartbergensis]
MIWSDDIADEAAAIHTRVRRMLREFGIPGDLVWTGASSVPRTLTRGDVDLHLRVPPESFATTVTMLKHRFPVGSPHSWADTLAVFDIPDQPLPTGLAVTPIDSEHDRRFTRAWSRIATDPATHRRYNELKSHPTDDYESRKAAFFNDLASARP